VKEPLEFFNGKMMEEFRGTVRKTLEHYERRILGDSGEVSEE
jgi:hypothetical protein